MADEDIREGDPDKPRKRKSPPPDDDGNDRPRRRDDDDDDFDRKRRNIGREDDDDGSNSPLSAVVPVGVSIWALASLYLALLGCIIPGFGLIAIFCGVMAFATHKQKASYGSISGNLRAILGIVIGAIVSAVQIVTLIAILFG
jgi:hypothetical protein